MYYRAKDILRLIVVLISTMIISVLVVIVDVNLLKPSFPAVAIRESCSDASYSNNDVQSQPDIFLTDEEIQLIALCTMAEAEGESEYGKRLVIDTILNRVDSPHFPNNVYDVVYQPHQFTAMENGRVQRCKVEQDICQLVCQEANQRQNRDCIFFMAGGWSKYGSKLFKVGNHYFSSYE